MLVFKKNKFNQNKKFFLISFALILLFLIASITLNTDNTIDNTITDLEDGNPNISEIVINEVMASNGGAYADKNGKIYDYIEIYNGSNKEINLRNYGLSDQSGTVKWVFPDTIVKAKGYIVVFLSGTTDEGLYANFKLKSSGEETVALIRPNGKVIDAIKTKALDKNQVLARNIEGNWVVQENPTPGFDNTVTGYAKFLKSLIKEDNTIVINEFLANNKGQFKDSYGNYSGYIEIKNTTDSTVDLTNYSLGSSNNTSFEWQFPEVKIKSGEVLVVFTSNLNITEGDELHTNFKLQDKNGVVTLANNKGKIISKVVYKNLANGFANIKEKNNYEQANTISPGYENTTEGIKNFQKKYQQNPNDLIINEVMNSNSKYLAQNGGEYYDWIEIKNNTNTEIKLSDYYLTTTTDNDTMYKLPDITLKSGQYYVVMASGNSSLSNSSYKHANFNISDIQSLYLIKDKEIIDAMFVANVPLGYSMGRGNDYGIYYISTPTPKTKNNNGVNSISYIPSTTTGSGIYNDIENLKVELTAEGTIYYTLDGTTPTTSSKVYKSSLSFSKTTVLKAVSYESGKLKSETLTKSYIINENSTLPVMSVSLQPSALKNLSTHAWTEGYIVTANAEYFEDGKEGFTIPCGLKLFGGSTRGYPKKSFELKFKKEYGASKLEYQVFDNRDFSSFNSIVLRTGSQDEEFAVIRDLVATSLVEKYTDVDVQAYKPIILYINGNYWGVYYIREKLDETFVGNHYNVNATTKNTDMLRIDNNVDSGSATKYRNLLTYIRNHSLSVDENYEYVKTKIDIENLIDFWIAETWTSNNDIVNCRYFSNPYVDNGKWKFIFYDLDFGMYNIKYNYYNFSTSTSGMTSRGYTTELLRNLMKSKGFKELYVERLSYNLKNTWSEKNVIAKINEVYGEIDQEMARDFAKWDQNSISNWKKEVEFLRTFAKERAKYMIKYAKSYFDLTTKETEKYFGDIE